MPMETEIPGEKTLEAGRGAVYLLVYRREGIVWGRERLLELERLFEEMRWSEVGGLASVFSPGTNGHFKATVGPGSMLCWIAFLDCLGYEFNIDARVSIREVFLPLRSKHSHSAFQNNATQSFAHLSKFCITFVFYFSWVLQSSQPKSKTMLMQNCGGANKQYYGRWANGEQASTKVWQ